MDRLGRPDSYEQVDFRYYVHCFGYENAVLVNDRPGDSKLVRQLRAQLRAERKSHFETMRILQDQMEALLRESLRDSLQKSVADMTAH